MPRSVLPPPIRQWLLFSFKVLDPPNTLLHVAVLSMDLKDASGELTTDNNIKNGVVHKFRLDRQGRQIGRDEFITPKPEGFFLRRKQSVSPQSSNPIDLCSWHLS